MAMMLSAAPCRFAPFLPRLLKVRTKITRIHARLLTSQGNGDSKRPPPRIIGTPTKSKLITSLYNPSGVEQWRTLVEEERNNLQIPEGSSMESSSSSRSLDLSQLYDPKLHLPSAPTDWSGYEPSTPVSDELTARIAVTGRPISTADFMDVALLHPEWGYYTRAKSTQLHNDDDDDDDDFEEAVGDKSILHADFLTSPEITSLFGETLGVWFLTYWGQQKIPMNAPFQLLECGPGTGQLMADWLTVCFVKKHPPQAIHLVEQSRALRQQQRDLLQTYFDKRKHPVVFPQESNNDGDRISQPAKSETRVYWHQSIADFRAWSHKENEETTRTLIVAQEFLDALPVYSFEKTADGTFRERLVDVALQHDFEQELIDEQQQQEKENARASTLDDESPRDPEDDVKLSNPNPLKPRLRMVLAPEVTPPLKTLLPVDEDGRLPNDNSPVGSIIEVCPQAILFAQDIAQIVSQTNGAALLIDYGDRGSRDSLRGYARHEQMHFLSRPGQIDITADVDFGAIQHAVNTMSGTTSAVAYGPMEQGQFLVSMGIQERVIALIEQDETSEEAGEDLFHAFKRLVAPEEMGTRYKVMAIVPDNEIPPPFEVTGANESL